MQEQFSVFNEILRSKNKNFRRFCVFHYIQKNLKYCNLLECNIFFGISVDKTERDDSETNKRTAKISPVIAFKNSIKYVCQMI